ncbi:MAG: hypothetical protein QOJ52_930 [Acidimicrobiaceae bacterium]|nr:hypothetical protein [Acidimicrobiaceae bacterium]
MVHRGGAPGEVIIPTSLADTALSVIHKGYRTLSGTPGVLVDGGIVTGASFTINSLTAPGHSIPPTTTIEWILVARG